MHSPPSSLQESYRLLIRASAMAAFFVHLAFIFVFASQGVAVLAAFNVLSIAAHAVAFWLARPQGKLNLAAELMGLEVGLHAALATATIGWETGFHYLMIPIVPVTMLSATRTLRVRLAISLASITLYIGLKLWSQHYPPLYALPTELTTALEYGCLATLFVFFMVIAARFRDLLAHTQEKLTREASTDPLTGALNRRRMGQIATELHSQRGDSAVLLCDLDHFKHINDRHGHEAGDVVLQAFHQQLQTGTRPQDPICRWGGEEFLILLPNTSMAEARHMAQRLCNTLAATPIPLPSGLALQVTVTIGLTPLGSGESLQAGVLRADEALYQGKAAGRNRVQEILPTAPAAAPVHAFHASQL